MKREADTSKDTRDDKRSGFPKISFARADSKVKILENRPVMQIPDEVPRRRTDASVAPLSADKKRLRDDVKPIFQREITFATPMKDGTAKKAKKDKNGKDIIDGGHKRGVKTI